MDHGYSHAYASSIQPEELVADGEPGKDCFVTVRIVHLQIGQQPAALRHKAQEAPARRMVLVMCFEMLCKLSDTAAQQRDLNLRRTGIGLVNLVANDDLSLCFSRQCH